jgi:4-cresol dehydrogenase (hydroxylating)
MAERFQTPLKWLTGTDIPEMLKIARPVHNMMKGIPTDRIIASTYWRKRTPVPLDMNPDRDGCGLMWIAPVAPSHGKTAQHLANMAGEIVLRHGFEPAMTITLLTERSMDTVISISYDREIDGEDQRATSCFAELLDTLLRQGFYPYRLGINSMMSLPAPVDDYADFLKQIKTTLDPNHILAPGRYEA